MKKLFVLIMIIFFFISLNNIVIASPKDKQDELVKEAKSSISHISSSDLSKKMKSDEKFYLIDVRTKAEYDAGHLAGAKWISRGKLEWGVTAMSDDPDVEMILYCRSGSRGSLAVQSLEKLGYKNVKNLDGGFKAWVGAGNTFYNAHGEIKIVNYGATEPGIEK